MNFENKTEVVKGFIILCVVLFLLFSGYGSVLVLQSSINIEGGTGVWSLMATYLGGALFNLLFTPVIIRELGARKTLIIAELSYLIYVAINFYPEPYLLIPAGLLVGFGEASMWPCLILYAVHFANCYAKFGEKTSSHYVTQFLGYTFTCLSASQVFGNLLSWSILYSGASSANTNETSSPDLSVCGINDCQDPNITEQNIGQYEPASDITLYATIGSLGLLCFLSTVISLIFIPPLNIANEMMSDKEPKYSQGQTSSSAKEEVTDHRPLEDTTLQIKQHQEEVQSVSTLDYIQDGIRHLLTGKQLLLTPYALYCGLFMSFNWSEITRAYASCLRGVDQVCLYMVISSAVDAITSTGVGALSAKVGRNTFLSMAFVLDVAQYMFLLFWIPTEENSWIIYLLAVVYGLINGTILVTVQDIHGSFFPENREFALSTVNMYNTLGWGIQYAWSTSLCVETKIYVQIAWSTLSIICYGILNQLYGKKIAHASDNKPDISPMKTETKF